MTAPARHRGSLPFGNTGTAGMSSPDELNIFAMRTEVQHDGETTGSLEYGMMRYGALS